MTVGRVITASVAAPATRLVPSVKNLTKISIPARPYIIDGIPASVSVASSTSATAFLFFAYSVRYIAAPMPSGSTKMSVISIM